jgi:cytochrome oxidase Cu insertion factor (SCO1/SenC/PrrC family)
LFIFFLSIVAVCAVGLAQMPYPRPQIASAEGKAAPDFTLRDQSGSRFHLADQHGRRLLLVFYRGYW